MIPHPRCQYAISLKEKYSVNNFLNECKIATSSCNLTSGCGWAIATKPIRDKDGTLVRNNNPNIKKINEVTETKGCVFNLLSISNVLRKYFLSILTKWAI